MTPRNIVVLGAGYTGVLAGKLLARNTGATVTVVNERDWFAERMRHHQLAAGRPPARLSLPGLFRGTGVRLIVDRVTRVDPDDRRVELATGEPLGYDLLVYALGSHADRDAVPGAAEHAQAIADAGQAADLRDRMRTAGSVAVVGAGPTGLETATELAESYPGRAVRLITTGTLGDMLSGPGRDHLHRVVDRLGIEVYEHARVIKVGADGLLLADGRDVAAGAVAWTAGFTVPALAGAAGLAVDGNGRLLVDGTLRSVSHPEVYGIGDAAAAHTPDGSVLRMGCGPGGLAALCAVGAITDRQAGREPAPLRVKADALCVSLGRRDGVYQPTGLDGTPYGTVRTGVPVALLKRMVLRVTGSVSLRRPGFAVAAAKRY